MSTSYPVYLDDTKALSTREFSFPENKTHEKDGMLYIDRGSEAEKIWGLLTKIEEQDPITGEPFPSLQSLHASLVYAMDSEMELDIHFRRAMDIAHKYKSATERGDKYDPVLNPVLTFDIEKVVKKAARLHSEWLVQVQLVHDLMQSYDSFRQYRIRNLWKAIAIKEETESNWLITDKLMDQMQEEISELERGVEPSFWFKVNEMMARITKRPMFSTRQFKRGSSITGEWSEDPYWDGFDGSVYQALKLVCVHVGGYNPRPLIESVDQ